MRNCVILRIEQGGKRVDNSPQERLRDSKLIGRRFWILGLSFFARFPERFKIARLVRGLPRASLLEWLPLELSRYQQAPTPHCEKPRSAFAVPRVISSEHTHASVAVSAPRCMIELRLWKNRASHTTISRLDAKILKGDPRPSPARSRASPLQGQRRAERFANRHLPEYGNQASVGSGGLAGLGSVRMPDTRAYRQ